MSLTVTRTIQVVCLLLIVGSILGIFGSRGDIGVITVSAGVLGFSVMIFLLAAILRVLSDVSEKVLESMGYRREAKKA